MREHDQPAFGESARHGGGSGAGPGRCAADGLGADGGLGVDGNGVDGLGVEGLGADGNDGDLFDAEELRELSGYARLAARLKEAHEVLCGMDLELPDRADFVRRLLVITAASRHDHGDSLERVERFLATVDQKRAGL